MMKRSFLNELYYKAFQTGNRVNTFIAINVLVFLLLGFFTLFDFFSKSAISTTLIHLLALPANLTDFLFHPWTLFTYMFTQRDFLHILFNLLWLYWMGIIFLDFLNNRQLTFLYIAGGVAAGLTFLLLFNLVPFFYSDQALLIGSSGSVFAILTATATLVPNYTLRLLIFGDIRLKYLVAIFIILNLLGLSGGNIGGNLAHLGGGLFGFLYIKALRSGNDWSKLFQRKPKLRVVKNPQPPKDKHTFPNQEYIDSILDKISQSGYNSLTKAEKEALFNAGKQQDQK